MQRDAERIYDEHLAAATRAGDRAAWERRALPEGQRAAIALFHSIA